MNVGDHQRPDIELTGQQRGRAQKDEKANAGRNSNLTSVLDEDLSLVANVKNNVIKYRDIKDYNEDELQPDDDDDDGDLYEWPLPPPPDELTVLSFGYNRWWIATWTTGFESLTCLMRFGFHLQSTKDTTKLAPYTFGLRIHHGYVGILMLILSGSASCCCGQRRRCVIRNLCCQRIIAVQTRIWFVRIGWSLILSDAIHHFLVLWPITGSPQFDLVYPKQPGE